MENDTSFREDLMELVHQWAGDDHLEEFAECADGIIAQAKMEDRCQSVASQFGYSHTVIRDGSGEHAPDCPMCKIDRYEKALKRISKSHSIEGAIAVTALQEPK